MYCCAMMMEAVCTSETSVNIYLTTQQYITEDSKLQLEYFLDVCCITRDSHIEHLLCRAIPIHFMTINFQSSVPYSVTLCIYL
jgi:hypothetical protein